MPAIKPTKGSDNFIHLENSPMDKTTPVIYAKKLSFRVRDATLHIYICAHTCHADERVHTGKVPISARIPAQLARHVHENNAKLAYIKEEEGHSIAQSWRDHRLTHHESELPRKGRRPARG